VRENKGEVSAIVTLIGEWSLPWRSGSVRVVASNPKFLEEIVKSIVELEFPDEEKKRGEPSFKIVML